MFNYLLFVQFQSIYHNIHCVSVVSIFTFPFPACLGIFLIHWFTYYKEPCLVRGFAKKLKPTKNVKSFLDVNSLRYVYVATSGKVLKESSEL